MFVSVNKKILYSLFIFLLLVISLFFGIFINLYSRQLSESQTSLYIRNQYVVELLNDNINMKKKLAEIDQRYPQVSLSVNLQKLYEELDISQQQLSRERQLNTEMIKNYDKNQEALIAGAKIVGFSLIVAVLFILALIGLLKYWVIRPIEKLTSISRLVSQGIFSSRIAIDPRHKRWDEFDILYETFNNMLDSIEKNIREIENREQFLQRLIDTVPEGIRVIDKDHNVIMTNKAFNQMFSCKHSCVGQKCYKAYGIKTEGCPQSKFNCPLKYFSENKDTEFRAIHDVGRGPVYINAAVLNLSMMGRDFYIVESLHDLSRDIRFSHQQKISSLAFLSTSVAHEMKNNLGAIRLILQGILDNDFKDVSQDDETKKYLTMAYQQLVETVKTPERLLRLAQYDEDEKIEFSVQKAIKDMVMMIDYDAKRHGISVETKVDEDIMKIGNEADFKMIILNLAQNAIKAMPDGGVLTLSAEADKRHLIVKVADTGIGIAKEKIKHIFEPFYSANEKVKSSGLGLAIVSSLVEKENGRITVESTPHKGTCFTIKIPHDKSSTQEG